MTTYETTVEHYGDGGLLGTETVQIDLSGEDELAYLGENKLRQAYQTLRQWSADAATTNTNWASMTTGQKDAAMAETIRRLGILMDRLADLLLLEGRS